jgi:hypothetical protein
MICVGISETPPDDQPWLISTRGALATAAKLGIVEKKRYCLVLSLSAPALQLKSYPNACEAAHAHVFLRRTTCAPTVT